MKTHKDTRRKRTRDPNIIQYPSGKYYFRGTVNGVFLDDVALKTAKWSVAVSEANKLRGVYNDIDAKEQPLTFETLHPLFMDEQKKRIGKPGKKGLRVGSYKEYDEKFRNYILPFFRYINVRDLNKRDELLEEFLATIDVKPRNIFKVLFKFLRWCQRKQYLYRLPYVELPDDTSTRKAKALRPEERKMLVASAPTFLCRLFILMYMLMAMRKSEILKLEWSRVFYDKMAIWLGPEHTKTKKGRWVPIHEAVAKLLMAWQKKSDSPYVFPNARDKKRHMSSTGINKQWKKAKTAAGLPDIVPHDLRRTWTTEARKQPQHSDTQLEKFAGSSAKVQKDIYTDFDADDVRSLTGAVEIEGLDDILMQDLDQAEGKS